MALHRPAAESGKIIWEISVKKGVCEMNRRPFAVRHVVCCVSAILVSICYPAPARAQLLANFDDLSEGQVFDTFTNGGIRFHDVTRHQGGYTNFCIDATTSDLLGPSLSPPNVLAIGGYVHGPNVGFGAFGAMRFTSDTPARTAGLDLWTLPLDMGGNTLTLTGYDNGGQFVNSDSFTFGNSQEILHYRFDLSTDDYASFSLTSDGPAVSGDSFIVVDNVTVAAVPEPATLSVLGLGLALLARRRKAAR